MKCRVAFVSVVPSPYQRDLFRALSERPEVALSVFYMEAAAADSPWPKKALATYEKVLSGTWMRVGSARCHINWALPNWRQFDVVVLNTLMSFTGQWLMRGGLHSVPWVFWGERLSASRWSHDRLTKPLHRAAGIAAVGSEAQRDYRARFPEPQSFCIPYHCDLAPFITAPRAPRERTEPVFLFCGQMIRRKGVDLLLQAFSRLPSGRLLLVGREAELLVMLRELHPEIRQRIEYAGFQPPEALPDFFSRADVFVLPSRYDGWGVVMNQALGAGLPIVCSDMVGAAHDLVDEGVNGTKFTAGDVDSLTARLQRFISEPELAGEWGANSRIKARQWSPQAGASKWVEAFRRIFAK